MAKKKIAPKQEVEIKEHFLELPMDEVMGDRFGKYAKEVIQNRAIPDARDGLKPVQRRIIFAMYDEGNLFTRPMKKCAHTVGAVMGKYHPHGDSSIYEALARMSQSWNLRYPIIDFQGNNGSIDGDSPAAYRYTEARLNQFAELLVLHIEKDTVDQQLTFDDTLFEPTVLPARFPNLLVNGSQGIAVGVATEIPPHNLREVIDAIIYRVNHKHCTIADLREFIKGPDFPTGGKVFIGEGLDLIYQTGRGKIEIEAKTEIVNDKLSNLIVIHEIPYQTNKSTLLREMGIIANNKRVDGIIEVRDESDRTGLRIVIEVKKEVNAEIILEYLLNKTQLRTNYSANVVAIADNRPKTLNLLDLIDAYLVHQISVITRRSAFDLAKQEKRLHIVAGLIRAISVVDEVVKTIRASKDKANAKENIMAQFAFSSEQAEAIVMLQLYKLTNTDITTLENEKAALEKEIQQLKDILANEKTLSKLLINDLKEIALKYGDERRTKIVEKGEVITVDKRDLIAEEDVMIALTRDGYIKRSSLKSYRSSGENALPAIKTGDLFMLVDMASTKDTLIAFTTLGNYLFIPIYEISDSKWKDEGKYLSYIVTLNNDERIVRTFIVKDFRSDLNFVMVTKKGLIKRSPVSEFTAQRYSRPLTAIKLGKGDRLADAALTSGNSEVLVVASNGVASFYNENDVTLVSLKAAGVKAISKLKGAHICGLVSVWSNEKIRIGFVTDNAHLRIFDTNNFEVTARLGKLQSVMRVFKSDSHDIVGLFTYPKNKDKPVVNLLTSANNILPVELEEVRPMPLDKYAKRNLDNLSDDESILGVFTLEAKTIDDKVKSEEPPQKVASATVSTSIDDDAYEQISIFDVIDEE